MFQSLLKITIYTLSLFVCGVCGSDNTNDNVIHRLPKTVWPHLYDLRLAITQHEKVFNGTLQIDLAVREATDTIVLNAKHLDVAMDSIALFNHATNQNSSVISFNETTSETVTMSFGDLLTASTEYSLYLRYSGKIRDDLKGLYRSRYFVEGKERLTFATFFAATYARMVFPCFDEPSFRASFKLQITHDDHLYAYSNMPATITMKQHTRRAASTSTEFKASPPMPTYLMSFVLCDFEYRVNSGRTFRVIAQKNKLASMDYALLVGQTALGELEKYTNVAYTLPKMDLVAIDDFLMGAMENWGLVSFKSSKINFNDRWSTTKELQQVTKIVSHEMAHQWFGNLVTPEWWSNIWMNEGFATFFEDIVADRLHPAWRILDQFPVNTLHYALALDAEPTVHPMTNNAIATNDQLNGIYDFVAYQKAGSILRMIAHILTPAKFETAIQRYIADRQNNCTQPNDLHEILGSEYRAGDVDIVAVFRSWEENPGYPVVFASRNTTTGMVEISQKRFVTSTGNVTLALSDLLYYVPINMASSSEPDFRDTTSRWWLSPAQELIEVPSNVMATWVIVNKQQTGYYRVNYDAQNWRHIIFELTSGIFSMIHPVNRAQLIDDSMSLAKNGLLSYDVAFGIVNYLSREKDLIPFIAAYRNLLSLNRILRATSASKLFFDFVAAKITPIYREHRLEEWPGDDHVKKLLRIETANFACAMGIPACVQESKSSYLTKLIPIDVRRAAYCGAFKSGAHNGELIKRLKVMTETKQLRYDYQAEINDIIDAMGCAESSDTLDKGFELSLETEHSMELEKEDRQRIFQSIVDRSTLGIDMAMDLFEDKYKQLKDNYVSVADCIKTMGSNVVTERQMQTFVKLITTLANDLSDDERKAFGAATELAEENLRWSRNYSESIRVWLLNAPSHSVRTAHSLPRWSLAMICLVLWKCKLQ